MNEEKKRITLFLPLSAYLQELILTGILGVMGVLFLLVALLAAATAGGLAVVFGVSAVFVLWLCVMSANSLYRSIEIMPDKLVISRFGSWRKEIPLEELKLFAETVHYYKSRRIYGLGISPYTVEELTRMQEEKLQKGIFSRQDLPFMKRKPGWEDRFARDFVIKRAKWTPFGTRDVLFLPLESEITAMLKLYYPGIPWMQAKENGTLFPVDQKDKDPLCYRRGRPGDSEGLTVVLLLLAILIVPFVMILMAQSLLVAMGPALLIALLVGLVYPLLKSEWDIIHLSPEKLQVMRDKKVYTELPAERIATIVVEKEADNSLNTPYIAVSELTPERLAACEVARRCKQKHGQKQCEALYALPDWQTRFAIGYCRYFANQIPMRKDPPIFIAYSTQREETLRSLYPTAKWLYNNN